jgi:hypothetical protein
MPDLIDQLGAYRGSVESAIAAAEATRSDDAPDRLPEDRALFDLVARDLDQSEPSVGPNASKRRAGVLAAVAAAALVVVGMVVIGDRDRDDPVTAPTPTGSASSPVQWSRVDHDEAVLGGDGNQWMSSVTSGGPGLVAVGSVFGEKGGYSLLEPISDDEVAAVWTSVDGVTWARVPHDDEVFGGPSDVWMNSVVVGGPGLVAVGRAMSGRNDGDAAVWTSADGATWTRVAHAEDVFGGPGVQEMKAVIAGGPGLVAVGWDGLYEEHSVRSADAAVWTSVDGITWTRVAHDEQIFGGDRGRQMNSVTVGGPGLVAVGNEHFPAEVHNAEVAAVWTSADGIVWKRVAHDDNVFGGDGSQSMYSIVGAGPGLVAVGASQPGDDVPAGPSSHAAVWTSVDGITWSRLPHDEAIFGGTGAQAMHSVTVTDAGLVAVGSDGGGYGTRGDATVWTSLDGFSWVRTTSEDGPLGGARMYGVTTFGTGIVAVGIDWLGEDREHDHSVVWRATASDAE